MFLALHSLNFSVLCSLIRTLMGLTPVEFASAVNGTTNLQKPSFHLPITYNKPNKSSWNGTRLPTNIKPLHYNIKLIPNLETGLFTGKTNITLDVTSATNFIVLNSAGLNITDVIITDSQTRKLVTISSRHEDVKNEFYTFNLNNELQKGIYYIYLEFNGSLVNKLNGFYKSTYKDVSSGMKRNIATSKFEPTYARQAFPCFDEPSFKSNFTVQLVKPMDGKYIALSNMNQVAEIPNEPRPGLTTVQFAKSVPMSTYVVCFIVCDFEKLEPMLSKQGFPVTVYARPGVVQNMKYALEHAVKTIDLYIDFFGINYPLPKLDLIAIPDFASGAMEHWGLVTFRETSVVYSEGSSSSVNKKKISLTVAHELAHMWFGNLVTMEWWNDLWLNEGFASFMEYKGMNNSHPDWDANTQILIDDVHRTLSLDSVQSSHPIVQTVSHPDQITEIFDAISYSKGATIIRMLENMIGRDVFQRGVSNYLKKFAYKNAETMDLWNALEHEAKGINISKVMDPFTKQKGFPLVNVERYADNLILTQQRFLSDANATFDPTESEFRYKWDIMLTYVTSKDVNLVHKTWLYSDQPSVTIALPDGTEWFKFNRQQFGYYRVRYNTSEWMALVRMLLNNPDSVTAADRANILDDAFSLAKAGYTSYQRPLEVIQYLPKENHFVPWIVAQSNLQYLQEMLSTTNLFLNFRKYMHALFSSVITDSLWNISEMDSYLERRRKILTLEMGCGLGVPLCVSKANEIFSNWLLKNGSKPEPELRALVYTTAMVSANETTWELLWQQYLSEMDPQEKAKFRNSLTMVREPWIIYRLIELAKDENNVRSQDFLIVIGLIADNPVGRPIVWDFVRDQWGYLVKRFSLNNRMLGTLIPRITSSFSTQTKLKELKTFLAENPEAGAGAAGRKVALERIENNIQWHAANLRELSSLFQNYTSIFT